jgi:hypothetical protein
MDCNTMCADEKGLICAWPGNICPHDCVGFAQPGGTAYPEEYEAMIACFAQNLGPTDYVCADQGGSAWPEAKAGTVCEALICKWTCDDYMFGDLQAVIRCGC